MCVSSEDWFTHYLRKKHLLNKKNYKRITKDESNSTHTDTEDVRDTVSGNDGGDDYRNHCYNWVDVDDDNNQIEIMIKG